MANFIPPVNGVSLGSYLVDFFVKKGEIGLTKIARAAKLLFGQSRDN